MLARLSCRDGARMALADPQSWRGRRQPTRPELFDGLGLIRTAELAAAGWIYGVESRTPSRPLSTTASRSGSTKRWSNGTVSTCFVTCVRHRRSDARRRVALAGQRARWDTAAPGQRARSAAAVKLAGDPAERRQEPGKRGSGDGGSGAVRRRRASRRTVKRGLHTETRTDPALWARVWTGLTRTPWPASRQRSQTSGRSDPCNAAGQPLFFYRRVRPDVAPSTKTHFSSGPSNISRQVPYALLGGAGSAWDRGRARSHRSGRSRRHRGLRDDRSVRRALPPAPARGLGLLTPTFAMPRRIRDARFILEIKGTRNWKRASSPLPGPELVAMAEPPRSAGDAPSPFAQPPTLGPATPGQTVSVRVVATNRGPGDLGITAGGHASRRDAR